MGKNDERSHQICALNDKLRCTRQGGRLLMTAGIIALGLERGARMAAAVARFMAFTDDNDPHGEHDRAMLTVGDVHVLWKIDYYDLPLQYHSPDPTNPAVTVRVLTIMRADEY